MPLARSALLLPFKNGPLQPRSMCSSHHHSASNSPIQLNSRCALVDAMPQTQLSSRLSLARWAFVSPKSNLGTCSFCKLSSRVAYVFRPLLVHLRGVVRWCCVVCLRCNRTLTTDVKTTTHSQTTQSDVRKTNRAGMEVLRVSPRHPKKNRVVAISKHPHGPFSALCWSKYSTVGGCPPASDGQMSQRTLSAVVCEHHTCLQHALSGKYDM